MDAPPAAAVDMDSTAITAAFANAADRGTEDKPGMTAGGAENFDAGGGARARDQEPGSDSFDPPGEAKADGSRVLATRDQAARLLRRGWYFGLHVYH